MKYSKIQIYVLCLMLVTALSCKDQEPIADCGCEGRTFMVVEDAKASYLGNGVLLLVEINEDRNFDHTFVSACSISDTLRITPDRQNPDYVVSGDIKKVCGFNINLDQTPRNFGVKAIKRRL